MATTNITEAVSKLTITKYENITVTPVLPSWLTLQLIIIDCIRLGSVLLAFVLTSLALGIMLKLKLWQQGGNMLLLITIIASDVIVSFSLSCSTLWFKLAGTFLPGVAQRCSNLQCGLLTILYVTGTTLEILLSLCLGIDRLQSILSPIDYINRSTKTRSNWIVIGVSIVISLATALAGFNYQHGLETDSVARGNFGGYLGTFSQYFYVSCMIVSYATIALYAVVAVLARKAVNQKKQFAVVTKQRQKRNRKINKLVLALIVAYSLTLCLGCTLIVTANVGFSTNYIMNRTLIAWGGLLTYSNPLVNVFIYAWKLSDLRAALQRIFLVRFISIHTVATSTKQQG